MIRLAMIRLVLIVVGITLGATAANLVPSLTPSLSPGMRTQLASWPGLTWLAAQDADAKPAAPDEHAGIHAAAAGVTLDDSEIDAAGIEVMQVGEGTLVRRLSVPGTIIPSGDRIARVAVKLIGTVSELRKRLGDLVAQNEVVAVIESREVADAKSEYLAARTTHDLQQTLLARAATLREGKAIAENDYLRTRAAAEDARIKMEVARQKLSALGLTEEQVAALPGEAAGTLRRHELRAPIGGRIAERRVDLGAAVGREGQESELFVIVDLDVVWAELAILPADLGFIREGQELTILDGATGARTAAKVIFIGPLMDKETRTARVVAAVANPRHTWRPGSFITAEIPIERQRADVVVPKAALQTINGEQQVFVRTAAGFAARKVRRGREDDRAVEILAGLVAGERVAARNAFVLKAELGKGDAEH